MVLRTTFWRAGAAAAGSAERAVFFFCCFFLPSAFASAGVSDAGFSFSRLNVSSSMAGVKCRYDHWLGHPSSPI